MPLYQSKHDKNWDYGINLEENLSYFSGTDIAWLVGFPTLGDSSLDKDRKIFFRFLSSFTLKHQQKLMGI